MTYLLHIFNLSSIDKRSHSHVTTNDFTGTSEQNNFTGMSYHNNKLFTSRLPLVYFASRPVIVGRALLVLVVVLRHHSPMTPCRLASLMPANRVCHATR